MNDASSPEYGSPSNPAVASSSAEQGGTAAAPDAATQVGQPTVDAHAGQGTGQPDQNPGEQHAEEQQEELIDYDKFIEERFPDMPTDVKATYKFLYDKLRGQGVVTDDQNRRLITDETIKDEIIQKLQEKKLTKEQVKPILEAANLADSAQINEIIDALPSAAGMSDEDIVEDQPEAEHGQTPTQTEAEDQIKEAQERLGNILSSEKLDEDEQKAIAKKIGMLESFKGKITDLFAEGEPGEKFLRIAKTVIIWAILLAAAAVVLDAVAINQAAGKRQR